MAPVCQLLKLFQLVVVDNLPLLVQGASKLVDCGLQLNDFGGAQLLSLLGWGFGQIPNALDEKCNEAFHPLLVLLIKLPCFVFLDVQAVHEPSSLLLRHVPLVRHSPRLRCTALLGLRFFGGSQLLLEFPEPALEPFHFFLEPLVLLFFVPHVAIEVVEWVILPVCQQIPEPALAVPLDALVDFQEFADAAVETLSALVDGIHPFRQQCQIRGNGPIKCKRHHYLCIYTIIHLQSSDSLMIAPMPTPQMRSTLKLPSAIQSLQSSPHSFSQNLFSTTLDHSVQASPDLTQHAENLSFRTALNSTTTKSFQLTRFSRLRHLQSQQFHLLSSAPATGRSFRNQQPWAGLRNVAPMAALTVRTRIKGFIIVYYIYGVQLAAGLSQIFLRAPVTLHGQQYNPGWLHSFKYYMQSPTIGLALVLWLVAPLLRALIIDPLNRSCITSSAYRIAPGTLSATPLLFFQLPPFSQSIVELDLRHLDSVPRNTLNQSVFSFKAEIVKEGADSLWKEIEGVEAEVNRYSVYVDEPMSLALFFELQAGYEAYKYLLYESVSIRTIVQNWRVPSEESSFLFVVSSYHNIDLPMNRPNINDYSGYFIDEITSSDPVLLANIADKSANSYWTTFNTLALPYIPYISNCPAEGDKMYLNQLLQNDDDCELVSIEDTVPIEEFKFGSSPTGDRCKTQRECVYDEAPGLSTEFPYWLNLPEGSKLFYITQNKISEADYSITGSLDQSELVPCIINSSRGANTSDLYPLNVKITLDYYQYTAVVKRMIACTVTFSLYMESSANFSYRFELESKPMNHTSIMLAFGFQWYVYMIVFVIIGLVSNLENIILWLFHLCVSRKQKKELRVRIYLRILFQIGKGTFIALVFCIVLLFSITIIMNGKIFNTTLYGGDLSSDSPRVFWDYVTADYVSDYQSALAVQFRAGRMGMSFLAAGSVILFYTSRFFIGCEKSEKEYEDYQVMGRMLRPRNWNRGKFIFGTYVYICLQFFFIYFAYSSLYSANIWTFIVITKIIQIILEEVTKAIYQDVLPCLPMKVITDIVAYLNTLSANNFYDFLFSFLIDVAITMIEKAYISQLQNTIVDKINEKVAEFSKFYNHLINDTEENEVNEAISEEPDEKENQNQFILMNAQTEEVKFFENHEDELYNDDEAIDLRLEQAKSLQKLINHKFAGYRRHESKLSSENGQNEPENEKNLDKNEDEIMKQQSEIFEMLLDLVLLLFTFLLQPFVILLFWITYDESMILSNYGIDAGTVILYLLSALVISFFTVINMIVLCHLLEAYSEIDFEQQIVNQLNRFLQRTIFWKAKDEDINREIDMEMRGAEHYCLSWQLYFILAIYINAMMFVILGISIMINVSYNPFKDIAVVLVVLFWCAFTIASIWLVQFLGRKINIDGWADFEYTSTNANAVVDYDMKEPMEKKSIEGSEQVTNQALVVKDENSEMELVGSTFLLRKRKNSGGSKMQEIQKMSFNIDPFDEEEDSDESSQISEDTLSTKINTICKKLEPKFEVDRFSLEYFRKERSFLKQNIQSILPLMQNLPQINEYRVPSASPVAEPAYKKQAKNYDMNIIEIMNKWRLKTDQLQQQRTVQGRQIEEALTECKFCFEPWGIYYGYGGLCLKCTKEIEQIRKDQ